MPADWTLPVDARRLIPHRPPMLLLGRLCEHGDGWGVADARLGSDSLFTCADGTIHPVALVELMAQGYAAVRGYDDVTNGLPMKNGLLVGIRRVEFRGTAAAGNPLEVRIRRTGAIGGFILAEAEVSQGGGLLARGSLKLYIPEEPFIPELPA